MDAKTYLRQAEMLDMKISNKLIECQQWRELALGITANIGGDRVQSSGNQQKMASAIERCVDVEAEINALVDELIDTKREIIATIEQLNSPTEYNILHKRYIQLRTLEGIADDYGKEYTWVTTTHGRALKNVQKILDRRASE